MDGAVRKLMAVSPATAARPPGLGKQLGTTEMQKGSIQLSFSCMEETEGPLAEDRLWVIFKNECHCLVVAESKGPANEPAPLTKSVSPELWPPLLKSTDQNVCKGLEYYSVPSSEVFLNSQIFSFQV